MILFKHLKRYPVLKDDPLQAWDSADELILQEISGDNLEDKKILILNDSFGALSTSLQNFSVTSYSDSFVSARATALNSKDRISTVPDLDCLNGMFDYVLIKIPKSMAFFEDILCHLTKLIHRDTKIICGVMVKHLASASFDLLNKYLGPTTTGLARKKARLIFAAFHRGPSDSPYPLKIRVEGFQREFINHSNLFSREKLDVGTRFFLEHIPRGSFKRILDLGCANGIVGIKARELNAGAELIFCDESFMAVKSAGINYKNFFQDNAEVLWTNCYEDGLPQTLDLVLCNPPFHQQTTIGDFIAWQMFIDAQRALKAGGILRVIGNSHLGYQHKLKKIFGNCRIIATNQKFMIIDCIKRDAAHQY